MSSPGVEGLIASIVEGKAPDNVRSAAARGVLPLPRPDLARLQVVLLEDLDQAIRTAARASLDGLDGEELREVLKDAGCSPEVLKHFTARAHSDEKLAELIAFHTAVPDAAIAELAAKGNGKVIDLVLTNQERLLSQRGLLDLLTANPALTAGQRAQILELLDRMARAQAEREEAGEGDAQVEPDPEAAQAEAEEAARLLDLDVGELLEASEIIGAEEFEQAEDPAIRSAYRKILTLNTAQRAILAMKGGREERQILVRDTNKVVALSVLKNPRINETEVERIANMRNVSDEVLRTIAHTRDWAKNYTIVKELVRNPRTPPAVSQNFVSRLMNQDLKNLSKDRNVAEVVRKMAQRLHTQRTQNRPGFGRR